MERNFPESVQKSEKDTYQLGNNVSTASLEIVSSGLDLPQNSFQNIHKLASNTNTLVNAAKHSTEFILSFEELEMLEAELENQLILPQRFDEDISLAQRAAHEASFLRWKAIGIGLTLPGLNFVIDVKTYLLHQATNLTQQLINFHYQKDLEQKSLGQIIPGNNAKVIKELKYLDALAGYLNGNFENSLNRYQAGLNLILKVLLKTRETPSPLKQSPGSLVIKLPMEKNEFIVLLKTHKTKSFSKQKKINNPTI